MIRALAIPLLLLVTPPTTSVTNPWPPVSICTEVEFTTGTVQRTPTLDSYTVAGYVRACAGADNPEARWSVARYGTATPGVVAGPTPYGEPGSRGYHFLYRRYAATDTWAVCVVNEVRPSADDPSLSTANRVACLGPDPDPPNSPLPQVNMRLVPVPVDDPRFEGALIGESDGPRGICSGCV